MITLDIVSNNCGNDLLTRIITILTSIITIMAMSILKVTTGTPVIQALIMISVLDHDNEQHNNNRNAKNGNNNNESKVIISNRII